MYKSIQSPLELLQKAEQFSDRDILIMKSPCMKAPVKAPINRPRFNKEATQEASKSDSFNEDFESIEVN